MQLYAYRGRVILSIYRLLFIRKSTLNTEFIVLILVQYFSSYCLFKVFVFLFFSLALLEACSLLDIERQILAKMLNRYGN